MNDILESMFYARELYSRLLAPIAEKYALSPAELAILMFLHDTSPGSPARDTAADIVRERHMTKSAVSMAVRSLSLRGLLSGSFTDGNRRSVHLCISPEAAEIAEDGLSAQREFVAEVTRGFSDEERLRLRDLHRRMIENMRSQSQREV